MSSRVSASGFNLRLYQRPDFDALHAIDQVCFPRHIAYGRGELRHYLQSEGAHCIVAELKNAIAGFILTGRRAGVAHIITLDVLEPYRRKSLGSLLLQAAEQEAAARGATLMYLETATTNKAAIALWKKHGYCETATIDNFYGHGQHAFEMQKKLQPKVPR